MKILSLYLCFLFLCLHTSFAQKVIVRGRVTDAKTGEALSDANILEKNSSIGMAKNKCLWALFYYDPGREVCASMLHVGVYYLVGYVATVRQCGGGYSFATQRLSAERS